MLPMRPGAVAHLTVASLEPRLGLLYIGKDKTGADRVVSLSPALNDFLTRIAGKRDARESLFIRECGEPWDKDAWKKLVHRAVTKAGLPAKTVLYTLHHSTITNMVCAGADLLTVAKINHTSVAMIEKHYGHLRHQAAAALSTLLLAPREKHTIDDGNAS